MAKKGKSKKEDKEIEKEEGLNEGTQEDINEADDSFGLPDIDYKPLDEISDEEKESESSEESDNTEEYDTTKVTSGEFQDEFIDDSENEDAESDEEEFAAVEKPVRRFEHPEKSSSTPKIIIGILLAIIVLAAGYYFGIYKPQQAEKARIALEEQQRKDAEEKRAEEERQARLEREREEAAQQEVVEAEPEPGTSTTISESTGRYYVVIGSFIDADLAGDLVAKLSANGVTTMVLMPKTEKIYTRVALSDFGSWAEAQSVAEQMKGEYGDKVWVYKY